MRQITQRTFLGLLALLVTASVLGKELSDTKPLKQVSSGMYSFSAQQSMGFWLDLQPGTYTFTLTSLTETGQANLNQVWLSTGYDTVSNGANDFGSFDVSGKAPYQPFAPVTHTFNSVGNTRVYLDLQGANLNKGFAGTLSVTAAPVPEPATGAMLLAGLGLMGAMVRRRKLQD